MKRFKEKQPDPIGDGWHEMIVKAAASRGITLPAPGLYEYIRCSKCRYLFRPAGRHFINHMCKCKHIKLPLPISKSTYKERDNLIKKLDLHETPIPVDGINLLLQCGLIFEVEGVSDFRAKFHGRRRAIKTPEIYEWIISRSTEYFYQNLEKHIILCS